MVFVTKDSWLVCRMLGQGRKAADGGFESVIHALNRRFEELI
jgi:hypothetical protein